MINTKQRKPRRDSKLHGLPKEQRALVDKWLFDKGLTYQKVSEACLTMFGLRVSKSSVGRYHQTEIQGKVRRKREERRKGASGKADKEVGGWSKEMCLGMLTGRGASETEEAYQKTLARMTNWALAEMQWPVEDERDLKGVLRVMRILISARREKNEADIMKLTKEKFEMKAAKRCIRYWRSKVQSPKPKVTETPACGQHAQGLHRGEKDPMMTWNFPDGEIRRLPLMRQTEPAPTVAEGTGLPQKRTKETKE